MYPLYLKIFYLKVQNKNKSIRNELPFSNRYEKYLILKFLWKYFY